MISAGSGAVVDLGELVLEIAGPADGAMVEWMGEVDKVAVGEAARLSEAAAEQRQKKADHLDQGRRNVW